MRLTVLENLIVAPSCMCTINRPDDHLPRYALYGFVAAWQDSVDAASTHDDARLRSADLAPSLMTASRRGFQQVE